MRVFPATTFMLAHLATRSFGFSPALSRGGVGATARHQHVRRPRPAAFTTTTTPPSPPTRHSSPSVTKMVLRPDWEREGRVYGLRMPPERVAERAFEYLVDYPCEFTIKVIGINEGSFADDIAATVSAVCEVRDAISYGTLDKHLQIEVERAGRVMTKPTAQGELRCFGGESETLQQ